MSEKSVKKLYRKGITALQFDKRIGEKYLREAAEKGYVKAGDYFTHHTVSDIKQLKFGNGVYSYEYNVYVEEFHDLMDEYEELIKRNDTLVMKTSHDWLDRAERTVLSDLDAMSAFCAYINACEDNNGVAEEKKYIDGHRKDFEEMMKKRREIEYGEGLPEKVEEELETAQSIAVHNLEECLKMLEFSDRVDEWHHGTPKEKRALHSVLLEFAFPIAARTVLWKNAESKLELGVPYSSKRAVELGYPEQMADNLWKAEWHFEAVSEFIKEYLRRKGETYKITPEKISGITVADNCGKYRKADIFRLLSDTFSHFMPGAEALLSGLDSGNRLELPKEANISDASLYYFDNTNEYRIVCPFNGSTNDLNSIAAAGGEAYIKTRSYGDGKIPSACIPEAFVKAFGICAELIAAFSQDGEESDEDFFRKIEAFVIRRLIPHQEAMLTFNTEESIVQISRDGKLDSYELSKAYAANRNKIYSTAMFGCEEKSCISWMYDTDLYTEEKIADIIWETLSGLVLFDEYMNSPDNFKSALEYVSVNARTMDLQDIFSRFGTDLDSVSFFDRAFGVMALCTDRYCYSDNDSED